jgi:predicted AAA+ superfamily ATPase
MSEKYAILEMYNFWDGQFPDLGYQRDTYLEKLDRFAGNRLVKVLTGQRRVGKSYLLRQMIRKLVEQHGIQPQNIVYLNMEYTVFDFIADHQSLDSLVIEYRKALKPRGKVYLFIDEVQEIDGWERSVNSFSQSHAEEYEVFISGSNAQLLSGELATLLSGRYVQFDVFPFTFREYSGYYDLELTRENFIRYMQSGGMPEMFRLTDEETRRHYMSALKDTVLLRDIVRRYSIKDVRLLEDIFAFLVNTASNLVSVNSLVKYFAGKQRKTNYETVASYIAHMVSAYLIHQAERYSIKGKDILAGSYKYYLNDQGFKNYLYPGFEYGYGYMLENLVYLELRNHGYTVYVGHIRDREIDFVAMKQARTMYLQVTYLLVDEQVIDREYGQLESIADNSDKYVVSLDDIALPDRKGIKHIQAWNLHEVL